MLRAGVSPPGSSGDKDMLIGFIGLGQMGRGVAANLMKGGHTLRIWNRSPEPVEALAAQGAQRAQTPAEAFEGEAVFSMLAEDDAIEEVLLASGVLDQARAGTVHVNLAT